MTDSASHAAPAPAVHRAVCPGTFDPVTRGHLDIFTRAARLFDEVVVAIGVNASKNRLFSPEERIEMLRAVTEHLPNVRIAGFTGLLTEFCREQGAVAVVKGLRDAQDFAYEQPMAQMNAHLTSVETVYLGTAPAWGFVSSSLVKEVASYGGDVSALVPEQVHERLLTRLAERRAGGDR